MHALLNFHDKKTKNFYIRTALINFHNKKTKNFHIKTALLNFYKFFKL